MPQQIGLLRFIHCLAEQSCTALRGTRCWRFHAKHLSWLGMQWGCAQEVGAHQQAGLYSMFSMQGGAAQDMRGKNNNNWHAGLLLTYLKVADGHAQEVALIGTRVSMLLN